MGENLKYIVYSSKSGTYIVLFSSTISHDMMWDSIRYSNTELLGAGFVNSNWVCYGESKSLKTKSRPEDTRILQQQIGGR